MLKWVVSGHHNYCVSMAGNTVQNPLYQPDGEELSYGMPSEKNTTKFWVSQPKQMNKRISRSLDNLLGDDEDGTLYDSPKRKPNSDRNNNRGSRGEVTRSGLNPYVTVLNITECVSGESEDQGEEGEATGDDDSGECEHTAESPDLWETRSLDGDFFSTWKKPHRFLRGSDPLIQTARGRLQNRRSKLNDQINRELRLRAGAENLYKATSNKKLKETIAIELSFVNSNLQLLKEELVDLNSSVTVYQNDSTTRSIPMIPLGLKETKEIDVRTLFQNYICEHYHERADDYSEEISCLSELRQACRTPTRNKEGLELLFQYYNQLYFVDKRFFPPNKGIGLFFEWYDSLTGVPTCQKTVGFEKGSVLFNIGALYTQLGARQDRCAEEGITSAIESFAQAAGAFSYLEENFTNAPSMDMQPNTLSMLRQLMLSQAQECVYERTVLGGVAEGMKPHLRAAHEAAMASALYKETYSAMTTPPIKNYVPYSWVSMVQVKQYYLKALAHYHVALAVLEQHDSGNVSLMEEVFDQIHVSSSVNNKSLYLLATRVPRLQYERRDLAKGHLRQCILCVEESLRVHSVSRQLRKIDTFQDILKHSHDRALKKFSELEEEDDFAELLLVPDIKAQTEHPVEVKSPNFINHKVDDIFHKLGPLSIFSARHDWSPRQRVELTRREGVEFGFSVRGNSPVIVAEVERGGLAHQNGMKVGDFIVSVGATDARWSRHDEVVSMIRVSGDNISLNLITPKDKNYLEPGQGGSGGKTDATPPASPAHTDGSGSLPRKGILKNAGSGKGKGGKPKSPWILRRKRSRSAEKEKKRKEVLER